MPIAASLSPPRRIRLIQDGRQEPAHFEPEVRKRKKARMASPDELPVIDIHSL